MLMLLIQDRLQTIIGYDRIVVMDSGKIAQFDTPLELFRDTEGIFHSMCIKSSISEDDIRLANKKMDE
jgi:ABC-type multidrug transport system fused ATPase/permease subunit